MEQAMSNLEFVKSLEGQVRKVVVRCYVQGFMYTYGKLIVSIPERSSFS